MIDPNTIKVIEMVIATIVRARFVPLAPLAIVGDNADNADNHDNGAPTVNQNATQDVDKQHVSPLSQ